MKSTDLSVLSNFYGDDWPLLHALSHNGDEAKLSLTLQVSLTWFRGHFPGHPVLAGVVQTHWATEFGKVLFNISTDFLGIENLKFQRIIQPGEQLDLILSYSGELNRIAFIYTRDDGDFSKGRIRFR